MSILITLIMLSVLIVAHECGHFVAARLNGVQVQEFALGMGPVLLKKVKNGTQYSLRLFPIGGYVKMLGEEGEEDGPDGVVVDPSKTFYGKKVWQRMAITVAGALMNFVVAILFFIIAFAGLGAPSDAPVIGRVLPDGTGFAAGFADGDRILEVGGQSADSWTAMSALIRETKGEPTTFLVERDGKQLLLQGAADYNEADDYYMMGIEQSVERRTIGQAIVMGFTETVRFTKEIISSFVQMITGQMKADLTGPVGMTTVVGDIARSGMLKLLLLTGVISINLGVFNLFPLPALDGGRLVFLLIEGLRGKPVDPSKENMVHFIGLMALFGLMIIITYQDIVRLVAG